MGKPTGFMEYERHEPPGRDPEDARARLERVPRPPARDDAAGAGRALHGLRRPLLPHRARCSTGMAVGLPDQQPHPGVERPRLPRPVAEALDRLHKTNNFPEFTGRVCPAPCEGSCVLGISEPPVTIKSIECAIIDKGFEEGWVVAEPPEQRTGKKVAVVGSGPGGPRRRGAAQPGRPHGHRLRARRPHRRPAHVRHPEHEARQERRRAARRADGRRRGSSFVTGAEVGKNYPADEAAGGVRRRRPLRRRDRGRATCRSRAATSRASTSPWSSCTRTRKSLLDSNFAGRQFIAAKGKDVIVIGGGDTGTDCVGTSLRHGCKSLVQFEILPQPARRARRRQPLAAVAARSTSSTTARRRRRRCSAPTRAAT